MKNALQSILNGRSGRWILRLRERLQVWIEFSLDRKRYLRAMAPSDSLVTEKISGENREAQLTKDYHRVEKGLTLPTPKRPFGAAIEVRLQLLLEGPERSRVDHHAIQALSALRRWNESGQIDESISPVAATSFKGLPDPEAFFNSRFSVRNFSSQRVDIASLSKAALLASSTPSVCNRQAWTVRYFSGEEANQLLGCQNGNSGFGSTIPVVALITTDSRLFSGAGERNQAWIEGGLFSMSLALAFHSLGLQTCMLNMSVRNRVANKVRDIAGLHEAELVIMLMAVGHASPGHRRAMSPRHKLNDIVKKLPSV